MLAARDASDDFIAAASRVAIRSASRRQALREQTCYGHNEIVGFIEDPQRQLHTTSRSNGCLTRCGEGGIRNGGTLCERQRVANRLALWSAPHGKKCRSTWCGGMSVWSGMSFVPGWTVVEPCS